MRSALTGKIINGGNEVILVNEAEEYLKKTGYNVYKVRDKSFKKFIKEVENVVGFVIMFVSVTLLLPLVSADTGIFSFDLTQWENRIILGIMFVIAGVMYFKENYVFSGSFIMLISLIMIFNSVNLIICLFIMALGIFILTQDGRE